MNETPQSTVFHGVKIESKLAGNDHPIAPGKWITTASQDGFLMSALGSTLEDSRSNLIAALVLRVKAASGLLTI